ncbi:MAG TPA: peptidoglycan editing factor PgeF [Syntrophorhabdaceae bacterium]|nr:peptidoglycan editing factor PgeF [Syntrophorhabdaceae bacterium]
MDFKLTQKGGWTYFYIPEMERKGLKHGFFTSSSPDLIHPKGDRAEFLEAFLLKDVIILNQEHGDTVHVIKSHERPKIGDGLIITQKHIGCIIKTADCLSVIIYDFSNNIAAIVHAGWRGTVKRITEKAVRIMKDLGCKPDNIEAILGPSINSCCYTVGEELYNIFIENGFSKNLFKRGGKGLLLSLRGANIEILKKEGISQIYNIEICTSCNEGLFYSYRRGDRNKRQINFVSLS